MHKFNDSYSPEYIISTRSRILGTPAQHTFFKTEKFECIHNSSFDFTTVALFPSQVPKQNMCYTKYTAINISLSV